MEASVEMRAKFQPESATSGLESPELKHSYSSDTNSQEGSRDSQETSQQPQKHPGTALRTIWVSKWLQSQMHVAMKWLNIDHSPYLVCRSPLINTCWQSEWIPSTDTYFICKFYNPLTTKTTPAIKMVYSICWVRVLCFFIFNVFYNVIY